MCDLLFRVQHVKLTSVANVRSPSCALSQLPPSLSLSLSLLLIRTHFYLFLRLRTYFYLPPFSLSLTPSPYLCQSIKPLLYVLARLLSEFCVNRMFRTKTRLGIPENGNDSCKVNNMLNVVKTKYLRRILDIGCFE